MTYPLIKALSSALTGYSYNDSVRESDWVVCNVPDSLDVGETRLSGPGRCCRMTAATKTCWDAPNMLNLSPGRLENLRRDAAARQPTLG
jgi:hypothetical protein